MRRLVDLLAVVVGGFNDLDLFLTGAHTKKCFIGRELDGGDVSIGGDDVGCVEDHIVTLHVDVEDKHLHERRIVKVQVTE